MKTSDPMGLEVQNLNCSSENVKKNNPKKHFLEKQLWKCYYKWQESSL